MNPKRVEDSYTEQVQVLGLANMNGNDRLFGGTLMSWIDIVAAVVAEMTGFANNILNVTVMISVVFFYLFILKE